MATPLRRDSANDERGRSVSSPCDSVCVGYPKLLSSLMITVFPNGNRVPINCVNAFSDLLGRDITTYGSAFGGWGSADVFSEVLERFHLYHPIPTLS